MKKPPKGPRLVKPSKEIFDEKYSFYGFVRWILRPCLYTGLLAISELKQECSELTRNASKTRYSIAYWVALVLQGIKFFLYAYDSLAAKRRMEIMYNIANSLINLASYCAMLFMMRFSIRWEPFIKQVESLEKILPSTNYRKTVTIIQYLIAIILAIAIANFFLIHFLVWKILRDCSFTSSTNIDLEAYCKMMYSWLFNKLPFHYLWIPLLLFLDLQIYLLWNYMDIFIMTVSIYLCCKFQDFNKLISQKKQSASARGVASWSTLQVYYTQMSRLVTLIDENINPLILLSYFSNIFFIMRQVFYVTRELQKSSTTSKTTNCFQIRNDVDIIIFFTSTCFFTIIRMGLVSYFASNLHLVSREPLQALHTFPSSAFNIDMERLMTQVYYSKVSLTGCSFFAITRSMILAMVGTLIMYELVLFQI